MGKTASQRRLENRSRCIDVYPADTTLGWRVVRQVRLTEAAQHLAAGAWREVYDERGNFLGCQVLLSICTDQELPSGASSTSITLGEVMLNAGLGGRSRTLGRSEEWRLTRPKRPNGRRPAPEDAIERAIEKVKQWPWPASRVDDGSGAPKFGDRAVRVYPKSA
ncbi:hypothetical protein ACOBR2_06595 [Telmatobacter bradus]|uniref:hypothetical protein n=1 Tax=Telmatobacter bradus TaxID=474953 RepID=UPI003B438E89